MSEPKPLCGVILADKPEGWTSFDVVAKLRGITKIKRLGHAGTLDPMATGVLPVFAGRATAAIDLISDREKRYCAKFALGAMTDTQDSTGAILKKSDIRVSEEDIKKILPEFLGEISQIPPMYSAVRVGGRRLYELAREGKTVERSPRKIEIYKILLSDFSEDSQTGSLEVSCSKGTYIRTLINDIGERLGCFGMMTALRRTCSQGFDISLCRTLDEIEAAAKEGSLGDIAIPVERCFEGLARIDLSPAQEKMFRCGVRLDPERVKISGGREGLLRVYGGSFLGLAEISPEGLKIKKSFWET